MKSFEAKHYLLHAQILWDRIETPDRYPYSLPAISKEDTEHFVVTRNFLNHHQSMVRELLKD